MDILTKNLKYGYTTNLDEQLFALVIDGKSNDEINEIIERFEELRFRLNQFDKKRAELDAFEDRLKDREKTLDEYQDKLMKQAAGPSPNPKFEELFLNSVGTIPKFGNGFMEFYINASIMFDILDRAKFLTNSEEVSELVKEFMAHTQNNSALINAAWISFPVNTRKYLSWLLGKE